MKNLFCSIALMLAFATAGCSALRHEVVTVRAASTNLVPLVTTANGLTVTNLVPQLVPAITFTNVSLQPGIESGIQTVTNVVPVPGVGAGLAIALGISHLIFGFLNKKRLAQAQQQIDNSTNAHAATLTHLDLVKTAVSTLVDNFEELRKAALGIAGYPFVDDKVMAKVKELQQNAGVQQLIAKVVKENTGDTKGYGTIS